MRHTHLTSTNSGESRLLDGDTRYGYARRENSILIST